MNLNPITILPDGHSHKPDSPEVERLKLSQMIVSDFSGDIEKLLSWIGEKGCSFYPGSHRCVDDDDKYLDGVINGQSLRSSRMLVLDIDNNGEGIEPLFPNQALLRLRELGLNCSCIYQTFSDPIPKDQKKDYKLRHSTRYRIIILTDDLIISPETYNYWLDRLYTIFPEADRRTSSDFYYGGKGIIYTNLDYMAKLIDIDSAALETEIKSGCNHPNSVTRKVRKHIEDLPDHIIKQFDNDGSQGNDIPSPKRVEGWVEKISNESELFSDFVSGRRKIWHDELLGLFLAMRKFIGGEKVWRECVKKNEKIDNIKLKTIATWTKQYEKTHNKRYFESYLKNYAPYNDPVRKNYLKLSHVIFKRNQPAQAIQSEQQRYISLDEARKSLGLLFRHQLSKWDDSVTILKVATGVGKTYQLSICEHMDGCLLSFPRHDLVQEVSKVLQENGIAHNVFPELPELPEAINEKYESLRMIGDYSKAMAYLRNFMEHGAAFDDGYGVDEIKLRQKLNAYFSRIEEVIDDPLPLLCTHHRMIHTKFDHHHMVIIDEDITENLIDVKTIKISTIRAAINILDPDRHTQIIEKCKKLIAESQDISNLSLEQKSPFRKTQEKRSEIDLKFSRKLISRGINEEFLTLLRSDVYTIEPVHYGNIDGEKMVCFLVGHRLPDDKRYMILSATASEIIYDRLFPQSHFVDMSNIQLKGTITQFSNRSFSRSSFKNDATVELVKNIGEMIGDMPVITYKGEEYQKYFRNSFRHFENLSGTNELEGSSLVALGTTNKPPYFYRLMAHYLGINYTEEDTKIEERLVRWNGYQFYINTFGHPDLQKIQFHFIESILMQAIGRARLLQNDATVILFSSFPVKQAQQHHTNQLEQVLRQFASKELIRLINESLYSISEYNEISHDNALPFKVSYSCYGNQKAA